MKDLLLTSTIQQRTYGCFKNTAEFEKYIAYLELKEYLIEKNKDTSYGPKINRIYLVHNGELIKITLDNAWCRTSYIGFENLIVDNGITKELIFDRALKEGKLLSKVL